jgi:RES domain-containing protein
MVLWRISRHLDLSGIGGLKLSGRWHFRGQPIVYFAKSPASALLEVCVHTSTDDAPPDFTLLRISGPDDPVLTVSPPDLPDSWQDKVDITRERGTRWLRSNASVLLRVPSAIIPRTSNYLFNPFHPDAHKFQITESFSYPFDPRLKR